MVLLFASMNDCMAFCDVSRCVLIDIRLNLYFCHRCRLLSLLFYFVASCYANMGMPNESIRLIDCCVRMYGVAACIYEWLCGFM